MSLGRFARALLSTSGLRLGDSEGSAFATFSAGMPGAALDFGLVFCAASCTLDLTEGAHVEFDWRFN